MQRIRLSILFSVLLLCLPADAIWADVPPPPANQHIGIFDTTLGNYTEADCRVCHDVSSNNTADQHHALYGSPIPPGSIVPYPELAPSGVYTCQGCHGPPDANNNFVVERNCVVCHTESDIHHGTDAQSGSCTVCHGDLVDDMDDGHTIPSYTPTLVTPRTSGGDGLPANSRGTFAGGCNYCHDNGGPTNPAISTNVDLHHGTGVVYQCSWCHEDFSHDEIRTCEGCHGVSSLHNIQADSNGDGVVSVGTEDPGYGHVGSESDCWGCHGFAKVVSPTNNPDRHHNLYRDGTPGNIYGCLSCHDVDPASEGRFRVERNCSVCHPTWNPVIEDLLEYFDDSVDSGTLEGVGQGNSANNKLNAFNNMLENISALVEDGDITGACQQISDAVNKCDGTSPPMDFVEGDARSEIYSRLNDLWLTLPCTSL